MRPKCIDHPLRIEKKNPWKLISHLLGPIYTKRQRQRCYDTCNSVLNENNRVLQNGFATHFQATPLFSMRTESQASSQGCVSVDADAWCKQTLTTRMHSSRMRTGRSLTVCCSLLPGGSPWSGGGVSPWSRGVSLPGGLPGPGGFSLPGGVCLVRGAGVCLVPEGGFSGDPP